MGRLSPYAEISRFCTTLPPVEVTSTVQHARDLLDNGNEAFNSGGHDALYVKPLLITTESNIWGELEMLRQQKTNVSVAINANINSGGTSPGKGRQNLNEIIAFQKEYPDFPLSYFMEAYPVGVPIGKVVRDANHAALLHAASIDQKKMRNVLLIRGDADTVEMSDTYLPNATAVARDTRHAGKLVYPPVIHDRLDQERYPNINRLLDWYDLTTIHTRSALSAHFAVDALGYVMSGGLDAECSVGEVMNIYRKAVKSPLLPGTSLYYLHNDYVRVSCRRIALRSAMEGYAMYDELRVRDDGEQLHHRLMPKRDISEADYRRQAGWRIFNVINRIGDRALTSQLDNGATHETAVAYARVQMQEIGSNLFAETGEPVAMERIVQSAIKNWHKNGPPTGARRNLHICKARLWNLRGIKPPEVIPMEDSERPTEPAAATVASIVESVRSITENLPTALLASSHEKLQSANSLLAHMQDSQPDNGASGIMGPLPQLQRAEYALRRSAVYMQRYVRQISKNGGITANE